jgi:hypothetical protein
MISAPRASPRTPASHFSSSRTWIHPVSVAQQFPVRGQRRAHASGGNPHLMDCIMGVHPHEGVLVLELLNLLPKVGEGISP